MTFDGISPIREPVPKFAGRSMAAFTFEIVRPGKRRKAARVMALPDDRAVWCHVEAFALRIKNRDGAFIRVKNSDGQVVVRAGVATAVASIEECSCTSCPLKREARTSDRLLAQENPDLPLVPVTAF